MTTRRTEQILSSMAAVRAATRNGVTVEALDQVKDVLNELARQRDLFPESDFPVPEPTENNHLYCIYQGEDGEYALYVDVFREGESSAPHDHGDSWAVVSGIAGHEIHRLYERRDSASGPGTAEIEQTGTLSIGAGEAVSMLVGGIHSVEAVGGTPVLMLHCYGKAFEDQAGRLEYNVEAGTCQFGTSAVGAITDIPLDHP